MLGEGFLRVLLYREKRMAASAINLQHGTRTSKTPSGDVQNAGPPYSNSLNDAGPNKEELVPIKTRERSPMPQSGVGVVVPGCSSGLTDGPHSSDYLYSCSLLRQYPDVRLRQELDQSDSLQSNIGLHGHAHSAPAPVARVSPQARERDPSPQQSQQKPGTSIPDQGYLVMGGNPSLDLPGSGLEPMSNSLLNRLLEKQLEEVYLQHLTDSLARCNSQMGPSLLRGLVPPPQPCSAQPRALDSLDAALDGKSSGVGGSGISYLNTQSSAPLSSHFSSPVLRISEVENVQQL